MSLALVLLLAKAVASVPPPRPAPAPVPVPVPVEAVAAAPVVKPVQSLASGGLGGPMPGLQGFAANGTFLKGLNTGDPGPQCRQKCGSDRGFCIAGGGDDSCDTVWRQCLKGCGQR